MLIAEFFYLSSCYSFFPKIHNSPKFVCTAAAIERELDPSNMKKKMIGV